MINTIIIYPEKQGREKITTRLSTEKDIKVLAEGEDGYDALKLISNMKPDIALLDSQLEFIEGGEIPPLLRARSPGTAVVILTAHMNDHQLYRAAFNEVAGFIVEDTDMVVLPLILRCIAGGGCYISPYLAARVLHVLSSYSKKFLSNPSLARDIVDSSSEGPTESLSKTELRVLTHIGEGNTSDEIARKLGLAVGTVRNYISSVMHKTGMRNRSEMARYAFIYGLVPLSYGHPASSKAR